eukprot:scaffold8616_cov76-Phaeocystis_antarctica.AAC.7
MSTHHDGSGATLAMRASALFLSSGELSQASTANSKSCACESVARRDRAMRDRAMRGPELPIEASPAHRLRATGEVWGVS